MKKSLLIFALYISHMFYAWAGYHQNIDAYKVETNKELLPFAARGAMMEYCYWAQDSIKSGAYTQAVDIYQQALQDTFLLHDNHTFIAVNLAKLYNNHLLMHQSALQLLNDYHFSPDYKDSWQWDMAMAQTKSYIKQYNEALTIYDSLIAILPNPEFDLYASRGYLHMSMHNYENAVQDLSQAMRSANDSTNYYRIASNIAFAKAETQDCEGATADITACLQYAQRSDHDIDVSIYHRKRAQIHLMCGDTTAAIADYRIYWTREKQYIIDNFSSMTEQQRLDYWANRKPLVSGIFRLENYAPAFLADVSIFRHQAALLGVHDTTPAIIQSRMQIDAKHIQRCLKKDETAIEFVKYKNHGIWQYAAIILNPDIVHFVPICAENQLPIDAICSSSMDDKNDLYNSSELGSIIWKPLLPYIKNKKDIWFAPDGILNMLAIEYLKFPSSQEPNIHRLTSIGILAERSKRASKQRVNALLIGGLDYDGLDDGHPTPSHTNQNGLRYWVSTRNHLALFTYLPGSREEVDNIAPNIARWEKTYAESEELLKEEFGRFNLVHLSTHGYSLDVAVSNPDEIASDSITIDNSLLGSGFALSGANISYRYPYRDDGLLTAREICELNLQNVDFVVASACQSAQGKVSDEGPAGILRSLKLAGVKCVLATLWPVDDTATTIFMEFFYEAWQNGKDCTKQQALLRAQQQLKQYGLQTPRTKRVFKASKLHGEYEHIQSSIYNAPYYWAPFILVDDIEEIK